MRVHRTAEAKHNPTKDMIAFEDLTDDALPMMTSHNEDITPGAKYAQIGEDAMVKLLCSIFDNFELPVSSDGVCLVDLNMGFGCTLKGFLRYLSQCHFSFKYWGLCENFMQKQYFDEMAIDLVAEAWLDGRIKSAASPPPALKNPENPAAPSKPVFKVLVWAQDAEFDHVCVPVDILKSWGEHSNQRLRNKFNDFITKMELQPTDEKVQPSPAKKKRKVIPQVDEASPISEHIVPACDVGAGLCVAQWGPSKEIRILPESKIALVNLGTSAFDVTQNTSLVSFGKIKFMKKGSVDNDREAVNLDPATDIAFNPIDYNDLVLLNNKVVSLGSIIEARQKDNPASAKLCYHEIIAAPTAQCPAFFELKQVHCVFARIMAVKLEATQENPMQANVTSMGSTIEVGRWTSDRIKIIWQVKWFKKGLMPVCPRVILTFNAKVEVGSAVMLSP